MARSLDKKDRKKLTGRKNASANAANRPVLLRTAIIMLLCGVLTFVPLLAHLFQMMVLDHDKYQSSAIRNQTRSVSISADRGSIYDRNLRTMARSVAVDTIFIDPNAIKKADEDVNFIADGLSRILGVSKSFVLEQAADTDMYYKIIARKQPTEVTDQVRSFISENELVGIHIEPDSKREYPMHTTAAQIIGFVNGDNSGQEGLEARYDSRLKGTAGKTVTTRGNNATEMIYSYEKLYPASDGNSLVLTIDAEAQELLQKNLEQAIEKYDVLHGAFGIIMDVNTGEIVAMATLGSYDPNNYLEIVDPSVCEQLADLEAKMAQTKEGTEDYLLLKNEHDRIEYDARLAQWRNRCVSDGYEPGSTFKTITLAAAIEEGTVTLDDGFYCGGSEDIPGRASTLHCWKHGGHGSQTTAQSLQNSCNIAFAHIGMSLDERLYDYADAFGLMEYTGVDMSGEALGYFYQREDLKYNANVTTVAFGQSFKVTPIQLVRAIAAVVNGGYVLKPYVVSEILDENGNVLQKNSRTVIRQAISEETSVIMRGLLESVVTDGTAGNAKLTGYRIGGKTGTSEKLDVLNEFGQQTDDKIVSFVGVAPINDPKYVVLVALDTPNPATGMYVSGGVMAAPVVRDVFADVLPLLGVQPDYTGVDMSMVNVEMPDVRNLTEAEAAEVLAAQSLTYRTVGDGSEVTAQIPAVMSLLPGNSEVILYMGAEPPTEKVVVPDLTGLTFWEANQALGSLGLYVQMRGSSVGWARITGQDFPPLTEVDLGTTVTVELTDSTAID